MAHIFELVNQLFAQVVPVADFLWDFPTNIDAYANIPILGQLSIAFLLLLGGSLYFTLRFGFVQVKEFKTGIRLLTSKQQAKVGTSQLAAFLVSMGGRVGAGNYCRCNRGGNHWRTRSDLLDVGFRIPGDGDILL